MQSITSQPVLFFKTIQENLVALRTIVYQQLSKEEKEEMRRELLEVKELAQNLPAVNETPGRVPGSAAGLFTISDDFDEQAFAS